MSSKTNYYDIIIVGAGIAGLYSAYNIKKMSQLLQTPIEYLKGVGPQLG